MKISIVQWVGIAAIAVGLTACSSNRHHAGAGITDANGGMGADGNAYTQGLGDGSGGFQPGVSCQVPQSAGFSTQSYYFDFDSNDVHSEDLNRLQSTGRNLATDHSAVKVVGNTDSRGSREYNIALGWRRAKAVASALQQSGVKSTQISTDSNGAEKPIAFGSNDNDFQCNRRVDVMGK